MPTILIVDDDEFMRMLLEDALCERFQVITAGSGEEALSVLQQTSPAVILLDVDMPGGLDGYATCRRIKAESANPHVPVIFISGHESEEARAEGIAAGGVDYVIKPFYPAEVLEKVDRARNADFLC